jgi:hypothetical protein
LGTNGVPLSTINNVLAFTHESPADNITVVALSGRYDC